MPFVDALNIYEPHHVILFILGFTLGILLGYPIIKYYHKSNLIQWIVLMGSGMVTGYLIASWAFAK